MHCPSSLTFNDCKGPLYNLLDSIIFIPLSFHTLLFPLQVLFIKTVVQSDDEIPESDPIDCGDEMIGDNEHPITGIGIDNAQQAAEGKNNS